MREKRDGQSERRGQTEFTLKLFGTDGSKVSTIKALRQITGCTLAEEKDMLESAPTDVLRGVSEAEARRGKALLEEAGVSVRIE